MRALLLFAVLLCNVIPLDNRAVALDLYNSAQLNVQITGFDRVRELWTFDLSLHGRDEHVVAGFDGYVAGLLHQQTPGPIPTPTLDSPIDGTVFATEIDSHFLFRDADVLSSEPLRETIGQPGSSNVPPDAKGEGADLAVTSFGQSIAGTFKTEEARSDWDIAQLVMGSSVAVFNFRVEFGGREPPDPEVVSAALVTSDLDSLYQCGDFDFDGDVDTRDYNTLKRNWTGAQLPGTSMEPFSHGDCSGDGDIDTQDEIGLIQNWTGADRRAISSAAKAISLAMDAGPRVEPIQLITGDSIEDVLAELAQAGIDVRPFAPGLEPTHFLDATSGVAPVTLPEPATSPLLAVGSLGILGLLTRKRRTRRRRLKDAANL